MSTFEFHSVGRIVFGRGRFAQAGELAAALGGRALLIANGGDLGEGGPADRLAEQLARVGVAMTFIRQRGEPDVRGVDEAVKAARRAGCDLVIGLGGGSALDAAKAVAGLLTNGGEVLDYLEVVGRGKKITRPAAPWLAIPTTAGTGAEVTRNTVIACPEKHFKASIRGEQLLPRVALVDPELGVPVPPEVTARAGMDALCQLIESYTAAGSQPVSDVLALKGIALAGGSLSRAYADGTNLDAREDMALAAMLSGITLTNAGLGAVHALAAPLGASFPIPHGTICGALLPRVMAANVEILRAEAPGGAALAKYAEIGRTLTGQADLPDDGAADAGIRRVEELVRELRIPPLGRFGLVAEQAAEMADLAAKANSIRSNPVKLSARTLAEILVAAL